MKQGTINFIKQDGTKESIDFSFEILPVIDLGNALINGDSFCNAAHFCLYQDETEGAIALERYVSQRIYELGYKII